MRAIFAIFMDQHRRLRNDLGRLREAAEHGDPESAARMLGDLSRAINEHTLHEHLALSHQVANVANLALRGMTEQMAAQAEIVAEIVASAAAHWDAAHIAANRETFRADVAELATYAEHLVAREEAELFPPLMRHR